MVAATSPDKPADAVEVGRIVEGWGLKGWFRVQPFSDDPQALLRCRRWHLEAPEAYRQRSSTATSLPRFIDVAECRPHGDGLVAAARGVSERNAADALSGARIFVPRSAFPPARADEYYWADLIDLAVVNRDGVPLGTVAGLVETGPQTVLRVRPEAEDAEERMVPFVDAYIDDVDLEQRRIVVDWGLDY